MVFVFFRCCVPKFSRWLIGSGLVAEKPGGLDGYLHTGLQTYSALIGRNHRRSGETRRIAPLDLELHLAKFHSHRPSPLVLDCHSLRLRFMLPLRP